MLAGWGTFQYEYLLCAEQAVSSCEVRGDWVRGPVIGRAGEGKQGGQVQRQLPRGELDWTSLTSAVWEWQGMNLRFRTF